VAGIAEELGVAAKIDRLPEQPGDVPITYADVAKARRMLGYSPKVHIRDGLKRFVSWYRESRS
jgi:UDP-glucuronate 4-epimerase